MYNDKRREKWVHQRIHSVKRGIPFNLTFNEWWDIWDKSGKYEERGCKRGQYCMSRVGDLGAYEVGNVFIQLHSLNVSQAVIGNNSRTGMKNSPDMERRRIATRKANKEKSNG